MAAASSPRSTAAPTCLSSSSPTIGGGAIGLRPGSLAEARLITHAATALVVKPREPASRAGPGADHHWCERSVIGWVRDKGPHWGLGLGPASQARRVPIASKPRVVTVLDVSSIGSMNGGECVHGHAETPRQVESTSPDHGPHAQVYLPVVHDAAVTVTFVGLDRLPVGQPRFVVSALHELGGALHAYSSFDHHPVEPWMTRVRSRMSQALAEETDSWRWTTSAIRSQVFLRTPEQTGHEPVEHAGGQEVTGLLDNHLPIGVAEELLRPLQRLGSARTVPGWAGARGAAVLDTVELLVADPSAGARRFARFLDWTWQEWYAAEWERVEPTLVARARHFQQLTTRLGAAQTLVELHPAFQFGSGLGEVILAKVQSSRHDVAVRGLSICPTVFGGPHIYVADTPPQDVLLLIPLSDVERTSVPSAAELRGRLAALTNSGRLEVARAIASEPRTAGEIASLWRMDVSAVTRHLRTLAEVGLASAERRGRFVQYRLKPEPVDSLGNDLLDLLQR